MTDNSTIDEPIHFRCKATREQAAAIRIGEWFAPCYLGETHMAGGFIIDWTGFDGETLTISLKKVDSPYIHHVNDAGRVLSHRRYELGDPKHFIGLDFQLVMPAAFQTAPQTKAGPATE